MKKQLQLKLLVGFLFLSSCQIFAQWQNGLWVGKQANNWYFPIYLGLNFDTSPPTPLTDGKMIAAPDIYDDPGTESAASISDSQGNLLFYTNGVTVWNKNHQIMQNGEGLLGLASATQGALIIPKPGSNTIYYIFTTGDYPPGNVYGTSSAIKYSEVDMSLDNGLGAINENKNVHILEPEPNNFGNEERLTAVYNSDGSKVWVGARQDSSYYMFLITQNGVETTPVVSNIGDGMSYTPGGVMKFSPDGTKMFVTNPFNFYDDTGVDAIEVFNFNTTSGEVTGPIVSIDGSQLTMEGFEEGAGLYGAEFSPNGQFLYVQTILSNSVYQLDLSLATEQEIINSATLLYRDTSPYPGEFYGRLNLLQNANDGKIYMANMEYEKLHVINYPNNPGIACGFDSETNTGSIDLGGGKSNQSLPNFITSYFESGIIFEGECSGQDVVFSTLRIPGIESIVWDFGDPDSGVANTSTEIQSTHVFNEVDTYTVTAVITSNGAQQTAVTQITILPSPVAVTPQGNNLVKCADAGGKASFDLTQFNATVLGGQDVATFEVIYYASEADMQSGISIDTPETFVTTGQIIFAEVTNTITGCKTATSFTLIVNPLPQVTNPATLDKCADSEGNAVFDLTQLDSVILESEDPTGFMVTYYATYEDVLDNNPIVTPATFTTSGTTIYTLVENTNTGCSILINFDINVSPLPSFPDTLEYTGCSPFDLTAITANEGKELILSYYITEQDAVSGNNAIADVTNYVLPGNHGMLYILAQNDQGCQYVSELIVKTGNCEIPRGISPNNDGMNDSFDLRGFEVEELNIFNRYGIKVYHKRNYINQWYGQSNNGNELPTGTYYYTIKTSRGENKTGWIYINREAK